MERLTIAGDAHAAARDASSADSVDGPTASAGSVLRPADRSAVQDAVRDAIDRQTPLRIVGRATWLDAGRPVDGARRLELDALTGIVDYTPGDLTLTARAGTSLAEIAAATTPNGQWLTLAPWGGDAGSIGATAATASAGPMSGALGTPRDVVIGLEAITGNGDVIRGGGRVVKNVAGFDLTRLMVGAWGTLGVLTEISVRLRGLPERDLTVAMALPAAHAQLTELLVRLRSALIAPVALELVDASLARRLDAGSDSAILARLTGNEENVNAQRDVLAQLGDVSEVAGTAWSALRVAEPSSASVVRLSGPVGRLADTWATATRAAATVPGGFAHASVLRSVARVVLPNEAGGSPEHVVDALRAVTREVRIFERLPASAWAVLAPTAAGDRLSRGIRTAFDPHRLFNPGIVGDATA